MAGVLKKLFLVELEGYDFGDIVTRAVIYRKAVKLMVQQYASVGGQFYRRIWEYPSECLLVVHGVANFTTYTSNAGIVEVTGRIAEAENSILCDGITSFRAPCELLQDLNVRIAIDLNTGVGVIRSGGRRSANGHASVIEQEQLPIVGNDYRLLGDDMLRSMGLPEKLIDDKLLLEELSE